VNSMQAGVLAVRVRCCKDEAPKRDFLHTLPVNQPGGAEARKQVLILVALSLTSASCFVLASGCDPPSCSSSSSSCVETSVHGNEPCGVIAANQLLQDAKWADSLPRVDVDVLFGTPCSCGSPACVVPRWL